MAKTATATATLEPLEDIATKQAEVYRTAEEMILRLCSEGKSWRDLSSSQFLLCESLGWDVDRIKREFGRLASVVRRQQQAGTAAERSAARKRWENATAKLASEGNRLREELAKLQQEIGGKIAAMERDVEESRKLVARQDGAIAGLQQLVPEHVQHEANRVMGQAGSDARQRASECRRRIEIARNLRRIEVGSIDGQATALQYAERNAPDLIIQGKREFERGTINRTRWDEHVTELEREIPRLVQQLREAEQEAQAAVTAERDRLLSRYVPN